MAITYTHDGKIYTDGRVLFTRRNGKLVDVVQFGGFTPERVILPIDHTPELLELVKKDKRRRFEESPKGKAAKQARETGKPVMLEQWTDWETDGDEVMWTRYVRPDGSTYKESFLIG